MIHHIQRSLVRIPIETNRKTDKDPRRRTSSMKGKSKLKNMVVTPIVNLPRDCVSEPRPSQDFETSKSF